MKYHGTVHRMERSFAADADDDDDEDQEEQTNELVQNS